MEPPPNHVQAFRPGLRGVGEVFHAAWKDHAYPTHTHDTRTVLVVDRGAIGYALDRRAGQAPPRAGVTVLPPHVPHDGRALTEGGFAKRVLCLAEDQLAPELVGRAVDAPSSATQSSGRGSPGSTTHSCGTTSSTPRAASRGPARS